MKFLNLCSKSLEIFYLVVLYGSVCYSFICDKVLNIVKFIITLAFSS